MTDDEYMESRLYLIEQLHWSAERDLERLLEMGEYDRVLSVIEALQEKMSKPRRAA